MNLMIKSLLVPFKRTTSSKLLVWSTSVTNKHRLRFFLLKMVPLKYKHLIALKSQPFNLGYPIS